MLAATTTTLVVAATASAHRRAGADEPVRTTYLADCAVCHGSSGRGTGRGPSLVGVGRAALDYQLSTGRMPLTVAARTDESGRPVRPLPDESLSDPDLDPKRHEPAYPPATIDALVGYVWELTGRGGPDIPTLGRGDVAEGGEIFRLQCAACHSWSGDGGALLHREAPDLHEATRVQVAEAIRIGPGQMPVFGSAAITDEQLSSVVAYVDYLERPDDRGGLALGHLGPVAEGAVALAAIGVLMAFTRWIGERA